MNVTFVQMPAFLAKWFQAKFTDVDLQALELTLRKDPTAGAVMAGTGGIRKLRFAPPSRHGGKSGGFRVAYSYVQVADTIYLLAIFGKSDQANFTAAQKSELRRVSKMLTDYHRGL